jgi:hypothetical protein
LALLLIVGAAVRPVLIVACEIHAASFAHVTTPHDHGHDEPEPGGTDEGDGHGAHDQGSVGEMAVLVSSLVIADAPDVTALTPSATAAPIPEHRAVTPFRPPIA